MINLEDINNVPLNSVTMDRSILEKKSGKNIYYTICILGETSQKISHKIKKDLDRKLEEFNIISKDNKNNSLEEEFENKEQIELSKFYENLPKSTSIAIEYLLKNKIKILN